MHPDELGTFTDIFDGLTRIFPWRGGAGERADVIVRYMKALSRFTLPQVRAGAEACENQLKKFPRPAEWIELIPSRLFESPLPVMDRHEIAEWTDARDKRWNGDPCSCPQCRAAGVEHRLLRFVPESDQNGMDCNAKIGDRVVTRGHWAHGEELARWYAAKDAFWTEAMKYGWLPGLFEADKTTQRMAIARRMRAKMTAIHEATK